MIKQLKHISAKTKILLFSLILIILPSGILGYFGFKSIENRALRLKENYRGMARLIRDKLEGELLNLEGSFLRDISNRDWNQNFQTVKHMLSQVQEGYPLIGELFILDSEGSVIHPKVVLNADALTQSAQGIIQAGRDSLINLGEHYEFIRHDYPTALRHYQQAMRQASSNQLRSYTRMLIARCYFKLKDYRKAEEEYRQLFERSEEALNLDGTPMKIIGLTQLSETYAFLGKDKNQLATLLELYEELISSPEGFESYEFYLETVKNNLDLVSQKYVLEKNDLNRLEKLRMEEKIQEERVRYLEFLRESLHPLLDFSPARSSMIQIQKTGPPSRPIARDHDGVSHQIGYVYLPSYEAQTKRRVLVYQIDKEFVLTELLSKIENEGELGGNVRVSIFSEVKPLILQSKSASPTQALAVENLLQFFPWWKLVLSDNSGKSVEQIIHREKQIYGAILLSVFILILVGVIMTLRAATHEAEMIRLKSEFVSNVSHELKTPLALIRLFGETLEMDHVRDAEKQKKFSRIISRESQRLTHLIDNVLDFSKIDSGQKEYTFEEENLLRVISNTLEIYKFYLRDQGFEFDISIPKSPIYIKMDKDAISQALLNLLSNAEKYSKEQKYIGVNIIPKETEVWITVEDRGPGIPKSNLKHIFDKFYRGEHGSARDVQGSGLGLTIVKHIVESHGGEISVESEVDKGTRFTIKLPIKKKE